MVTAMSVVPYLRSNKCVLTMFQRLLLVPCAVLFFAACTDSYPREDELIVNALELNQFQRLEAMNELGQDAHPETTWIYRALPNCSMQMTVASIESGEQIFILQMSGAGVDISFNKADQVYGVQVQPREGKSLEQRHVFLSKTWVDAVEMSNLVRSFQMKCNTSEATMSNDRAHRS